MNAVLAGAGGKTLPYSFCFLAASLKYALDKLASGLQITVAAGKTLPYSFYFLAASLKCALGKLASGTDEGLAGWILPYSF